MSTAEQRAIREQTVLNVIAFVRERKLDLEDSGGRAKVKVEFKLLSPHAVNDAIRKARARILEEDATRIDRDEDGAETEASYARRMAALRRLG